MCTSTTKKWLEQEIKRDGQKVASSTSVGNSVGDTVFEAGRLEKRVCRWPVDSEVLDHMSHHPHRHQPLAGACKTAVQLKSF